MHNVLNRHLVLSCEMTHAHTPNTKAHSPGVLLLTVVLRFPNISIYSHLVSAGLKMSTEERVWSRLFNHRTDSITVDGLS